MTVRAHFVLLHLLPELRTSLSEVWVVASLFTGSEQAGATGLFASHTTEAITLILLQSRVSLTSFLLGLSHSRAMLLEVVE